MTGTFMAMRLTSVQVTKKPGRYYATLGRVLAFMHVSSRGRRKLSTIKVEIWLITRMTTSTLTGETTTPEAVQMEDLLGNW
jgi:Ser/Thr protein kinase RdoA (MazF antagonist)